MGRNKNVSYENAGYFFLFYLNKPHCNIGWILNETFHTIM